MIAPWVADDDLARMTRRYYLSPLLYLIATGLALLDARVGMALFVVIGSVYLLHTGTSIAPSHPHESLEHGATYVNPLAPVRDSSGSVTPEPGFSSS